MRNWKAYMSCERHCKELKKAEEIVNGSTMYTVDETELGADWVMSLTAKIVFPPPL